MNFSIYTMIDNGSGMEFFNKEDFLEELSLMIDDCINNGGTSFSVNVYADASCFLCEDDEEDDE